MPLPGLETLLLGAETAAEPAKGVLENFWSNFTHNLFKPLLLFFYMGFLVPILKVPLEFPYQVYQGLTIFLLIAIGWEGGEQLAALDPGQLNQVVGFMLVGFILNFFFGIVAYVVLRVATKLRTIDAATVAGYYGSDSAGTFATARGALRDSGIAFAPFMPVMLAIMEIPGCLVALFLVSKLRQQGMDPLGNMAGDPGYNPSAIRPSLVGGHGAQAASGHTLSAATIERDRKQFLGFINVKLLHELFLNQGLYLLLGGIVIGLISGLQKEEVTKAVNPLFHDLFQGVLCLFLLEMGITACTRLRDLKTGGWQFVAFALIAPNVFATTGMIAAHLYSFAVGMPLELGTYVVFAVLCGSASYIAVPAIQRLAIPEASPTLPLAASLGCTFSYNVTIGIPVYIEIARALISAWPVAGQAIGGG